MRTDRPAGGGFAAYVTAIVALGIAASKKAVRVAVPKWGQGEKLRKGEESR